MLVQHRKHRIPAAGLAIVCASAVVAAGAFASPGFAADNQSPPMPQPGDTASVLAPLNSSADLKPTQAGIQQALAGALSAAGLGPNARVAVYDTDTGELVYEQSSSTPATPASTDKILTAAAVLDAYGPDHRIKTTVMSGATANEVVLVGAGDPMLMTKQAGTGFSATASLTALADQTAAALKSAAAGGGETPAKISATVKFDDSLFSGPLTAPSWPSAYVSANLVSPITALMVDGGGGADPSKIAAAKFAGLLAARGIVVNGAPVRAAVPAGATELAASISAPLSDSVGHALDVSDNTASEVLAHLAGVKNGGAGSFEGGARAVTKTLNDMGISTIGLRLLDGSGLSRDDLVPPTTLGQVLNQAATSQSQKLWPITYGMPIAGFTGTLATRFVLPATKPGRGEVRAKTGSLTGVSSLAGLVTDNDGDLLTFVFMAPDAADIFAAQVAWDRGSAALSQCGCK